MFFLLPSLTTPTALTQETLRLPVLQLLHWRDVRTFLCCLHHPVHHLHGSNSESLFRHWLHGHIHIYLTYGYMPALSWFCPWALILTYLSYTRAFVINNRDGKCVNVHQDKVVCLLALLRYEWGTVRWMRSTAPGWTRTRCRICRIFEGDQPNVHKGRHVPPRVLYNRLSLLHG